MPTSRKRWSTPWMGVTNCLWELRKTHLKIISNQCMFSWLSVSKCQLCDRLLTCAGCTLPLTIWQLAPAPPWPSAGKAVKMCIFLDNQTRRPINPFVYSIAILPTITTVKATFSLNCAALVETKINEFGSDGYTTIDVGLARTPTVTTWSWPWNRDVDVLIWGCRGTNDVWRSHWLMAVECKHNTDNYDCHSHKFHKRVFKEKKKWVGGERGVDRDTSQRRGEPLGWKRFPHTLSIWKSLVGRAVRLREARLPWPNCCEAELHYRAGISLPCNLTVWFDYWCVCVGSGPMRGGG